MVKQISYYCINSGCRKLIARLNASSMNIPIHCDECIIREDARLRDIRQSNPVSRKIEKDRIALKKQSLTPKNTFKTQYKIGNFEFRFYHNIAITRHIVINCERIIKDYQKLHGSEQGRIFFFATIKDLQNFGK